MSLFYINAFTFYLQGMVDPTTMLNFLLTRRCAVHGYIVWYVCDDYEEKEKIEETNQKYKRSGMNTDEWLITVCNFLSWKVWI